MSRALAQIPEIEDQEVFNLRRWAKISADPFLGSLDYRIETDQYGQIIITPPPGFSQSDFQGREIEEKRRLYFEAGAEEVWVVTLLGELVFFREDVEVGSSLRCPEFPSKIV